MEPSAASTTVTGPVGERLQAGTEDAPVLNRPAPLRRLHDSGAGYKYPDLLTYLLSPSRSLPTWPWRHRRAIVFGGVVVFVTAFVFARKIMRISVNRFIWLEVNY